MDISKMRLVRISPYASDKVMFDHFPTIENEQMLIDANADSRDTAMSAGALCLYASTLLFKIHENAPEKIKSEHTERELALREMIKSKPKFGALSEEQVSTMAHNLILKDIRNSFAHGNFEISYDVYTKKLYYVLWPRRKDFVVEKPIIISKQALMDVNREYVGNLGIKYHLMTPELFDYRVRNQFGSELKQFILPVDMLRLAENYLDGKMKHYNKYKPTENRYLALYYPLLVSQLTYEQDDYYNMFERDSSIFEKIAHIRNAISHDGFEFDNKTFDITHTDRDNVQTDSLYRSVRMLKLIRDQKNLVFYTKNMNFTEEHTKQLIEDIKKFFDALDCSGFCEQDM